MSDTRNGGEFNLYNLPEPYKSTIEDLEENILLDAKSLKVIYEEFVGDIIDLRDDNIRVRIERITK